MRALGALLLLTGSLTACGGRSGLSTSGSYDGGLGSGTGSASTKVDSGSSTREAGADTGADARTDARTDAGADAGTDAGVSCLPAFLEAGTGLAGDTEIPIYHRTMPSCCPSERGPAPGTQPYGTGTANGCSSDSQCTSRADGRCFPNGGLVGGPGGCSYDQCLTDSDCPSGAPCVCRTSASDDSANVCDPGGNCVLDSDCGSGGYCSPSGGACADFGFAGGQGYYCHTASDTCINDADCSVVLDAGGGCPILQSCAYDTQAQHWACIAEHCCPP